MEISGKRRQLVLPVGTDTVLAKSSAKALAASLEGILPASCHSYRPGRGRETALDGYLRMVKLGAVYGVKTDIADFFPEAPLRKILALLECLFPADPALSTIYAQISPVRELPQGHPLSPTLSNLLLAGVDFRLAALGFSHIRYGDDFLVAIDSPHESERALETLRGELARLGLRLSDKKTEMVSPEKMFDWLGYSIENGEAFPGQKDDRRDTDGNSWGKALGRDREFGRTVYVTSAVSNITSEKGHLLFHRQNGRTKKVPWSVTGSIVVVGRQRLSGGVFAEALALGVPIFFQKLFGAPTARFVPVQVAFEKNLVSRQKAVFSDSEKSLEIAKGTVCACFARRRRMLGEKGLALPLTYPEFSARTRKVKSIDELRGVEGFGARVFFAGYRSLVADFPFERRAYNPPEGPVNAMLSLGYTLLYHRISAALFRHGLDPRSGFYHVSKGKHAALASDLGEELRFLCERCVLSMIALKSIKLDDFLPCPSTEERNRLKPAAFPIFVARFERTMNLTVNFPETGSEISYNGYIDFIVRRLAASLKLDVPYTPPKLY